MNEVTLLIILFVVAALIAAHQFKQAWSKREMEMFEYSAKAENQISMLRARLSQVAKVSSTDYLVKSILDLKAENPEAKIVKMGIEDYTHLCEVLGERAGSGFSAVFGLAVIVSAENRVRVC